MPWRSTVVAEFTGILLLFLSVTAAGCATDAPGGSDPFARPASTARAERMDPDLLDAMMDAIRAQNARTDSADTIDSVIVIRHGNVVLEEYPNPAYLADRRHHLFSVTKSITSLLVGIALDRGLIGSVRVPILDLFPGLLPGDEVQSRSAITLEQLLTMSAGLQWDEDTWPVRDPRNDFGRPGGSRDPVRYVPGKPQVAPPGERFWYNSGLSHVLSAVIAEVSGMTTLQFAQQTLFGPLGVEEVHWSRDAAGLYKGGDAASPPPAGSSEDRRALPGGRHLQRRAGRIRGVA